MCVFFWKRGNGPQQKSNLDKNRSIDLWIPKYGIPRTVKPPRTKMQNFLPCACTHLCKWLVFLLIFPYVFSPGVTIRNIGTSILGRISSKRISLVLVPSPLSWPVFAPKPHRTKNMCRIKIWKYLRKFE